MKIALGTAQFGMDYGIANVNGQLSPNEVFKILKYAWNNDIDTLDTASVYGKSESIIGEFIQSTRLPFKIISKTHGKNVKELDCNFQNSLEKLNTKSMYGCLIHNFDLFKQNNQLWEHLNELKNQGKIHKIGFSLYHTTELLYLLNNDINIDIIQIPYNIFDQRFGKYFALLKSVDCEIHVRSVFLQGLLFMDPYNLPPKFNEIKKKLLFIRKIAHDNDIPLSAVLINFANLERNVDKVIIGVDSLENLMDNIKFIKYKKQVNDIYDQLYLPVTNKDIIIPTNW